MPKRKGIMQPTLKTPNRYKASKSPAHTGSVSALATLISRTVPARGTRSTIIRNLSHPHTTYLADAHAMVLPLRVAAWCENSSPLQHVAVSEVDFQVLGADMLISNLLGPAAL